jgi:hypothetical protein
MILPGKHIKLSNSMLNIGAILLEQIDGTQTITMLWNESKIKSEINSFEKFTTGLDFLFILDLIEYEEGMIRKI